MRIILDFAASSGGVVTIVIGLVVLVVVLHLYISSLDGNRIEKYIQQQDGELLTKEWTLFGKGWLGEHKERFYLVTYRDREGNTHEATCKTSFFSGVYFTDDHVVRYAGDSGNKTSDWSLRRDPLIDGVPEVARQPFRPTPSQRLAALEEENNALREELQQLKSQDEN